MTRGADGLPGAIGPGRLVLVVGPSGAGKDTLIRAARERLAGNGRHVFPRRAITRPASEAEDSIEVDAATFEQMARRDAFAAAWTAHGMSYGVPAAIDAEIARGRTVVCNVSRTVVPALRGRYADVFVVEVTAPASVLAQRIAERGRPQDGEAEHRVARSERVDPVAADAVIDNSGAVENAARSFLDAIA